VNEITPHYLVITVGSTGDVHPFMRLASALRALGRQVTFISHSYHAQLVQSAGIPFIGLGAEEDFLRVLANPDLWDPKKAFPTLMPLKPSMHAARKLRRTSSPATTPLPFAGKSSASYWRLNRPGLRRAASFGQRKKAPVEELIFVA
jgi:hypothetical protein